MKKLMILGAMIGFSSGILLGLSQGAAWPDVFWRASLISVASSYLFRWWGRMWLRSWRQAQDERRTLEILQNAPTAKV